MVYCTSCGFPLPDDAVFCTNCGTKILHQNNIDGNADNTFSSNNPNSVYNEEIFSDDFNKSPKNASKKNSNSRLALTIIITVSILVILLISILVFVLTRNVLTGKGQDGYIFSDPGSGHLNSTFGTGILGDGDYEIHVIGAESTLDLDDRPALRVYFNLMNNSSYAVSSSSVISFEATQEGSVLKPTYIRELDEPYEPYYNSQLLIRPGSSSLCSVEFNYDPEGSVVNVGFFDAYTGPDTGIATVSYDPFFLPGKPSYVNASVESPKWTLDLPSSGTLDSVYDASVTGAELTKDTRGLPSIRVFYEFKNNGTEPTSLSEALYTFSYQDGLQLIPTESIPKLNEDNAFYEEIFPGESVKASCVFLLRNSDSPVEAEVEASLSYDAVGETFKIK